MFQENPYFSRSHIFYGNFQDISERHLEEDASEEEVLLETWLAPFNLELMEKKPEVGLYIHWP